MVRFGQSSFALTVALALLAACSKAESGKQPDSTAKNAGSGSASSGSSSGSGSSTTSTVATGKIGGAKWTYASARALPTDDSDAKAPYIVTLISEKTTSPCQEAVYQAPDKKRLEFLARLDAVGDVALDEGAEIQFVDKSGEAAESKTTAKSGTMAVKTAGKTSVKGTVTIEADGDNSVEGAVTIVRCCPNEDGTAYRTCGAN